jgi:hypothetical protein
MTSLVLLLLLLMMMMMMMMMNHFNTALMLLQIEQSPSYFRQQLYCWFVRFCIFLLI